MKTPYLRTYKTKTEEYEEKLKKRNETQEWIFGNKFGKSGGGAPLRDNRGNIISSLKTITNNNIYKYKAEDFSKGDINFMSNVGNNQKINNNNIQNNLISTPYIFRYNNNNNNSVPYYMINPLDNFSNNQNNNNLLLSDNSSRNNAGYNYTNNSYNSFIDLDSNRRDIRKKYENEKYRRDLLNQIEDNRQRINKKKKEIEEQNRIDEIKNQEYYIFKEKQAEEYEKIRKLYKNKKMKSLNFDGNVLNISSESKNLNIDQSNESVNNQEKKEQNEKILKISKNYEKIFSGKSGNMFEEKEELQNNIDKEYEDLIKSIEIDIDNQKNFNGNTLLKSVALPRREFSDILNLNNNFYNSYKNIGNELQLSNYERNMINRNKKKKYYIANDIMQKKIEYDYRSILKKVSNVENLTKSYKMEINPKIYFNDFNNDDSYYNYYKINIQKYKFKKAIINKEDKEKEIKDDKNIDENNKDENDDINEEAENNNFNDETFIEDEIPNNDMMNIEGENINPEQVEEQVEESNENNYPNKIEENNANEEEHQEEQQEEEQYQEEEHQAEEINN